MGEMIGQIKVIKSPLALLLGYFVFFFVQNINHFEIHKQKQKKIDYLYMIP